jgi:hypothetical protein
MHFFTARALSSLRDSVVLISVALGAKMSRVSGNIDSLFGEIWSVISLTSVRTTVRRSEIVVGRCLTIVIRSRTMVRRSLILVLSRLPILRRSLIVVIGRVIGVRGSRQEISAA